MFDIKNWLQDGLILQTPNKLYIASSLSSEKKNFSDIYFYFPDFFQEEKSSIYAQNIKEVHPSQFISLLDKVAENCVPPLWPEPSFEKFESQFIDFQKKAQSGILDKVVPVVFTKTPNVCKAKQRAYLLRNLLQKKQGFVYGLWSPQEGILGHTPEYLFHQKNSNVCTMALAGTTQNNSPLLTDAKETEEHQIVVDSICENLHYPIKLSPTYEWSFGSLKHLRTDITAYNVVDKNFLSLIHLFHPTPALGGYPKKQAWNWLAHYEKKSTIPRKRFGAPFGVHLSEKESFCLVAIRNIQWDSQNLILGSGCGLTKKSNLKKEWSELKSKREATIQSMWL